MKDSLISLPRIELLHPSIRNEVISGIVRVEALLPDNCKIRVVSGYRNKAEQDELFSQGRTKPGPKVTNATFGESFHNFGLAFDFSTMYDKDRNGSYETLDWVVDKSWMIMVNHFKGLGYTWGGDFKSIPDTPHLEKTFSLDWRTAFDRYNKKQFIPGTTYISL